MPLLPYDEYNYPPVMQPGQDEPPGTPEHLGLLPYVGSPAWQLHDRPEAQPGRKK